MENNNDLTNSVSAALGMDQTTSQSSTGSTTATTTQPATEPPAQSGDGTQSTPPATDPNTGSQAQQGTTDAGNDNPVKQLRKQYEDTKRKSDQQEALLRRIAESRNITVEELEAKLQEEEDKQSAQTKNIPIEVQRQIREQEEQIKQLQLQNIKNDYISRSERLRAEYNLTDQQIIDFSEKAKELGFNVFTPGLDLKTLYRAINYDTVVNSLKEQIRQEVLAEIQRGGNTNNIRQGVATPPNTNSSTETPSNQELMSELFKSFSAK